VIVVLGLVGCASPGGAEADLAGQDDADGEAAAFAPLPATDSTFAPVDVPPDGSTGTTSSVPSPRPSPDSGQMAGLVIAPESDGGIAYDRGLFEHWVDADGDGCDTRCEVLEEEQRDDLPGLRSGWISLYDGYTTDDASELEVDHVVALSEAWRSGAHAWDPARRRSFANDLDEPDALIAVTAATNRSKGDGDPARWQPSNRDGWCRWTQAWVRVKVKWALTADEPEVAALRNVLALC
jgi:hypothetical protein